MAINLTPRQYDIIQFIREYVEENEYAPTMQEIADNFGVSRPTVFEHIRALEAKGAVFTGHEGRARDLTLADEFAPEEAAGLPILGRIAAGRPITAVEDPETLDIDQLFPSGKGETFVLQVRGNSMIDEQIRDGDYVIVQRRDHAYNGETVVALVDGEDATLKRFYKEGDRIRLQPANEAMEPIYVDDCEIQGVVIGVLRKYK